MRLSPTLALHSAPSYRPRRPRGLQGAVFKVTRTFKPTRLDKALALRGGASLGPPHRRYSPRSALRDRIVRPLADHARSRRQVLGRTRQRHTSVILEWFGLALISLGGWPEALRPHDPCGADAVGLQKFSSLASVAGRDLRHVEDEARGPPLRRQVMK